MLQVLQIVSMLLFSKLSKLLIVVDEQEKTTAAISTRRTELDQLKTQMKQLTEQVANNKTEAQ